MGYHYLLLSYRIIYPSTTFHKSCYNNTTNTANTINTNTLSLPPPLPRLIQFLTLSHHPLPLSHQPITLSHQPITLTLPLPLTLTPPSHTNPSPSLPPTLSPPSYHPSPLSPPPPPPITPLTPPHPPITPHHPSPPPPPLPQAHLLPKYEREYEYPVVRAALIRYRELHGHIRPKTNDVCDGEVVHYTALPYVALHLVLHPLSCLSFPCFALLSPLVVIHHTPLS